RAGNRHFRRQFTRRHGLVPLAPEMEFRHALCHFRFLLFVSANSAQFTHMRVGNLRPPAKRCRCFSKSPNRVTTCPVERLPRPAPRPSSTPLPPNDRIGSVVVARRLIRQQENFAEKLQ